MSALELSIESQVHTRGALVDLLESSDGTMSTSALQEAVTAHSALTDAGPVGTSAWAVGQLLDSLVLATQWRDAQWNAEPDASRFATAARLRAGSVVEHTSDRWAPQLQEAAALLRTLGDLDSVAKAAHLLATAPIAPRLTDLIQSDQRSTGAWYRSGNDHPTPTVALLIRLQDEPVMKPTIVVPNAMHQFQLEARVVEWPADADRLMVTFASTYSPDYLFVSDVIFTSDALIQPLEIRIAGQRLPADPPLEITAQAAFETAGERVPTRLVGNSTLELSTFDEVTSTLQNLPATARRLQQMMSELTNALPNLSTSDRRDTRLLMEGVLRFAHTVLDDRLGVHADVDEAWFQRELKSFLQADPTIGARLCEAIGRAGGTTDLVLGNIILELKIEKHSAPTVASAGEHYAAQATQYGSAGDSQVSLLTVLDVSAKRAPAGVMGNEVAWMRPTLASGPDPLLPSLVAVAVIRGGFPRPSDFSR